MVCKSICKRVSVGLNSLARVLLFAGFAYAGTLSGASSFDFPGAIDTQAPVSQLLERLWGATSARMGGTVSFPSIFRGLSRPTRPGSIRRGRLLVVITAPMADLMVFAKRRQVHPD
jgi:hypothetical protein